MAGWTEKDGALQKTFELDSFRAAVTFVNRIADAAERANHHPDIYLSYKTVTVVLTSHDAGDVTDRDRALAATIDRLKL